MCVSRDQAWLVQLARCYFDPELDADLLLDNDDPNHPEQSKADRHDSVVCQVLDLAHKEPEDCWRFIQIACEMSLSRDQLELLGAGIFEDLMDEYGLQFIDRVEDAARIDRNVRTVVDAVWVMDMDQSVVRGIKAIKASPRPGCP